MNKSKKISAVSYTVVFLLITVVIGVTSCVNLINYYVNDEVDYNEWTINMGNKFETNIATTFFEKIEFVNLNGAIRNLLGQQEMNQVVKLDNGYLTTLLTRSSDEYLQSCADNLAAMSRYLAARGQVLIYAQAPCTPAKYDPQLPVGVEDYGNDNIDRFIQMLNEAGVTNIDFRETMYEDGIDHYDMMYKTDHHWTTEAGFYAYGVIEDVIKEKTGCEVDERISDISDYSITTYEDWHLGSRGQRTGRFYAGIDDFDLIVPKFETSIQIMADNSIATMQEQVYNLEPLSNREYTSRYTYDHVLSGAVGHYLNWDCANDIKILFISDSFGKAVTPFLMMGFREVCFLDNWDVSGITADYLDIVNADVVLLLYYPNMLTEDPSSKHFSYSGF